jgi:CO/xanthine dehydrogenase Mo-binding subunit
VNPSGDCLSSAACSRTTDCPRIDVQNRVPMFLGYVQRLCRATDASVIHEDVDRTWLGGSGDRQLEARCSQGMKARFSCLANRLATSCCRPGAPQLYEDVPGNFCCDWAVGDAAATDAAFAEAHHIAKIDLVNNRLVPNAMESRAALAEYEPATGDFTLYTSTQLPHVARVLILGIPERKLRVVASDVGGGFGSKQVVYAEEGLVTWAARKLERPVKWVADRSEAFMSDAQGRDHVTHAELALDRDGKFLGLRVSTGANIGAHVSTFGPNIPTNLCGPLLAGVYTTRAIYCEVKVVFRTPCRPTPIAAPAARKPPSCWSGWSISRRAISASIASRSGGATSSRATPFPIKHR